MDDSRMERQIARWDQLTAELQGEAPADRMRSIARQEINKQFEALLIPFFLIGAGFAIERAYGGFWLAAYSIAVMLFGLWKVSRYDLDPLHDRHLIPSMAQDVVRVERVKRQHDRGEAVWSVEREGKTRYLVAREAEDWDNYWQQAYDKAVVLRRMSSRDRKKQAKAVYKSAIPVLEQGELMARQEGVEVPFWVKLALSEARR